MGNWNGGPFCELCKCMGGWNVSPFLDGSLIKASEQISNQSGWLEFRWFR
jgi:hypothetical protein